MFVGDHASVNALTGISLQADIANANGAHFILHSYVVHFHIRDKLRVEIHFHGNNKRETITHLLQELENHYVAEHNEIMSGYTAKDDVFVYYLYFIVKTKKRRGSK